MIIPKKTGFISWTVYDMFVELLMFMVKIAVVFGFAYIMVASMASVLIAELPEFCEILND